MLEKRCSNCVYWKRDTKPEGKQPGVREDYRVCGRPRISKGVREWRAPIDSCSQFVPRKEDST